MVVPSEYLEAVSAGTLRRLLITIPPRSMKSTLVSILWPTWEWIQSPSRRWIFASHAETLALKHSLDQCFERVQRLSVGSQLLLLVTLRLSL